ncbi:MAG TPA: hypothetical protein VKA27_14655 [Sunxiuqinia sp.]|nr:hypothetical protein [Sunxiuqinia sp.]
MKTQTEPLLFGSVRTKLHQHHFITEQSGQKLLFERKSTVGGQIQLLVELFKAFTKGQIYLDEQNPGKIICRVDYTKHLVICLILALIIGVLFSWLQGFVWIDVYHIATPIFLITFWGGVLVGNTRLKRLLQDAINDV